MYGSTRALAPVFTLVAISGLDTLTSLLPPRILALLNASAIFSRDLNDGQFFIEVIIFVDATFLELFDDGGLPAAEPVQIFGFPAEFKGSFGEGVLTQHSASPAPIESYVGHADK
jgi:hypothetical protein